MNRRNPVMLLSHGTRNHLRENLRLLFGGMPCRVQVAALPWRATESGIEVMMVTSRDSGRWVLPKGWPEKGEEPYEAAAREAMEEAGVSGRIAHAETGRFYYGKVMPSGMRWRCEVHVYPLEVEVVADKWPERKKRTRRWFRARDAEILVREPDLGELIAEFAVHVRKDSVNPRESVA